MKSQTLYRLEVSTIDGLGAGTVKAYTPHRGVAEEWKKRGAWNEFYPIDMVIIEDLEELALAEIERKKQAALNKLTEEDRRILGLTALYNLAPEQRKLLGLE